MKILAITNPSAGGAGEGPAADALATLEAAADVTRVEPPSAETFARTVRDAAPGHDTIVVFGGDGSLNLTVNALYDQLSDLQLGLIPLGTGNDLARSVGIPLDDPVAAAERVLRGRELEIDVATVRSAGGTRHFVNACVGGFPVKVDRAIDEGVKKRFGAFAFWLGGAKAALDLERWDVSVDGRSFTDCVAVGVGNGRTCGGGMEVWPDAAIDDGLLDICVMRAESLVEAVRLATKVSSGDHVELPHVERVRAPKVRIESAKELEFNLDGELLGITTPLEFEVTSRVRFRGHAG